MLLAELLWAHLRWRLDQLDQHALAAARDDPDLLVSLARVAERGVIVDGPKGTSDKVRLLDHGVVFFDADGNPTKAAEGFARSCGTTVDQLLGWYREIVQAVEAATLGRPPSVGATAAFEATVEDQRDEFESLVGSLTTGG